MTFYACCSSQESELSKKDLIAHMPLMKEAAARNEDLAKSKVCTTILTEGMLAKGIFMSFHERLPLTFQRIKKLFDLFCST